MTLALGSRTSGVDGSSEGGRINTISFPGALVLYGVAFVQSLQRQNPKSKLSVAPVQVDGPAALFGTIAPVRIDAVGSNSFFGSLITRGAPRPAAEATA